MLIKLAVELVVIGLLCVTETERLVPVVDEGGEQMVEVVRC